MSSHELRLLAYESGFMKRNSRKIDAPDFLALMCLESQKGSPSYNDLASRLNTMYNISASKQAVWKRVNEPCVLFFQAVLSRIIKSKISEAEIEAFKACNRYRRVIIQDSTIIKLPLRLFTIFSGVANAHTAVCNARIQGVYDLLSGCFISFSIDPYSKNDFSAAPELELHRGDLVLRDRGYYTKGEIKRHKDAGADCIYRHKHTSIYLDPISGDVIDLPEKLENEGKLDIDVCLNNDNRTRVRLIAVPVSEEVANNRRMKAKREMKRHKPSAELLHQMSWTIFITTIPQFQAGFQEVLTIYRLRWRIEIIFKIWKSHMQFAKVHNVSENQLRVLLTARLIMIVVCTHYIYHPCYLKIRKNYNRELSMMKLFSYLMKNPEKLIELLSVLQCKSQTSVLIFEVLLRYCTYDKRKRLNSNQLLMKIFLS
jgi:hypothetical protein